MPKVCIYLPDRLHAEVRRLDLPLSSPAQEAIERAVADDDRVRWVRGQQLRTLTQVVHDDVAAPSHQPT